jgi:hypothetical protein
MIDRLTRTQHFFCARDDIAIKFDVRKCIRRESDLVANAGGVTGNVNPSLNCVVGFVSAPHQPEGFRRIVIPTALWATLDPLRLLIAMLRR